MTNQLQHQQRRAVDVRIPAIEKYAYCLCLHVKPTTIFIAAFKLIRALLFASIILNTEFAVNEHTEFSGLSLDERHRSTTIAVSILSRIIIASVSAVGIYAVVSGRAALLMPLYAVLLVDFLFGLPSFYNRDFEPSMPDQIVDIRGSPNNVPQFARYYIVLFLTITMLFKVYFLCVIWKCYRYLRLIEMIAPLRLAEIYPHIHPDGPQYPIVRVIGSADSSDLSAGHNIVPPPYESIASCMKPPNYEEAMKSSGTNFVNPAYSSQQTIGLAGVVSQSQNSTSPMNVDTNVPSVITPSGSDVADNGNRSASMAVGDSTPNSQNTLQGPPEVSNQAQPAKTVTTHSDTANSNEAGRNSDNSP